VTQLSTAHKYRLSVEIAYVYPQGYIPEMQAAITSKTSVVYTSFHNKGNK